MDRTSKLFNRILICIFSLLISAGPVLRIVTAEGKSYIIALAAAIAALVFCIFCSRKLHLPEKVNALNPVKCAVVLSAVCLVVKLTWVLIFRIEPTVDYATFYNTARAFAEETEFNTLYLSLFPHILGYGRFLGQFFKLFGSGLMVAPILNVFLTLATGIMIFLLLYRHSGLYSACLGYALWIICPSATLYNTMTLSEPYYTCMFFAFFCLVSYLDGNFAGKKSMLSGALCGVVSGLLLALINSARPIAAVAIIAFFIWYLLLRGRRSYSSPELKKYVPFAVFMFAVYIIFGSFWNAEMEKILGTEISSFPGYSVYTGFDPDTLGTFDDAASQRLVELAQEKGSEAAQQEMLALAKKNIISGKLDFAKLFVNKFIALLGTDEGGAYYSIAWLTDLQYSLLAFISNVFYYALLIFCVVKVMRRVKTPGCSAMILMPLCTVGIILAQMLVEVAGRYHYSLIPMIIASAAVDCESKYEQ